MLKKALWFCVVLYFLSVFWACFVEERAPEMRRLERECDTWSLRISRRTQENLELARHVEGLKSDFRYTEKILREELLLHKKGELLILVPED